MQRHLLVRVTTSLRTSSVRHLSYINLGPTRFMSSGSLVKLPQIVGQLVQSSGMETGKESPEILASLETVSSLRLSTSEDLKVRIIYDSRVIDNSSTVPIAGARQNPFVQNIPRR